MSEQSPQQRPPEFQHGSNEERLEYLQQLTVAAAAQVEKANQVTPPTAIAPVPAKITTTEPAPPKLRLVPDPVPSDPKVTPEPGENTKEIHRLIQRKLDRQEAEAERLKNIKLSQAGTRSDKVTKGWSNHKDDIAELRQHPKTQNAKAAVGRFPKAVVAKTRRTPKASVSPETTKTPKTPKGQTKTVPVTDDLVEQVRLASTQKQVGSHAFATARTSPIDSLLHQVDARTERLKLRSKDELREDIKVLQLTAKADPEKHGAELYKHEYSLHEREALDLANRISILQRDNPRFAKAKIAAAKRQQARHYAKGDKAFDALRKHNAKYDLEPPVV